MALPVHRIASLAAVLLVTVLAGGVYYVSVVLSDGLSFQRGDVAYIFVVRSDTIRDFPVIGPSEDDAAFFYSARDGTAPAQVDLRYLSNLPANRLQTEYAAFCRTSDYAIETKNTLIADAALACDAPDYRIETVFRRAGGATEVVVTFLER